MAKGGNKPKQMPKEKPVKLACGGSAKQRKGFPDTMPPKKGK